MIILIWNQRLSIKIIAQVILMTIICFFKRNSFLFIFFLVKEKS